MGTNGKTKRGRSIARLAAVAGVVLLSLALGAVTRGGALAWAANGNAIILGDYCFPPDHNNCETITTDITNTSSTGGDGLHVADYQDGVSATGQRYGVHGEGPTAGVLGFSSSNYGGLRQHRCPRRW